MSEAQGATKETNDNITADAIIKKIGELNGKVITATERAKTNLDNLKQRLAQSGIDAQKQKEQITKLENEIDQLKKSNKSLQEKAESLNRIDTEIQKLEKNINILIENNQEITETLPPLTKGGFQYKKTHPKYKGQSRSLHSNSKTTPRKRKKWRRRPGKSVKKGGMKTRRRRRRRNKKSKKSKKRRK